MAEKEKGRGAVYNGIALTVTGVWALANIVQIIDPSRPVSSLTHGIMATVASAFFGAGLIADRRRNGKDNDA